MDTYPMSVLDAAHDYIKSTGRFTFRLDLAPSIVLGLRIQEAYGSDGYLPLSVTRSIANKALEKVRGLAYA